MYTTMNSGITTAATVSGMTPAVRSYLSDEGRALWNNWHPRIGWLVGLFVTVLVLYSHFSSEGINLRIGSINSRIESINARIDGLSAKIDMNTNAIKMQTDAI